MNTRKQIRLPNYDYSDNGAYFITICTKDKKKIFGYVKNGQMHYNEYGKIAFNEIEKTNSLRKDSGVRISKFIVMPNHVHMLLEITKGIDETVVGTRRAVSNCTNKFSKPITQSVSTIVGAYKSSVTKHILEACGHGTPCPYKITEKTIIWQPRFIDHVIRNGRDYLEHWQYIDNNPLKWEFDKYYYVGAD